MHIVHIMKICHLKICHALRAANLYREIPNLNVPKGLRVDHIAECDLKPLWEWTLPPPPPIEHSVTHPRLWHTPVIDLKGPHMAKHSPKSFPNTGNNIRHMQTILFLGILRIIIRERQDVWRGGLPARPGKEIRKSSLQKATINPKRIDKTSISALCKVTKSLKDCWTLGNYSMYLWHSRWGLLPFPALHSLVRGTAGHVTRTDSLLLWPWSQVAPLIWWMSRDSSGSTNLGWWLWWWQAHSRLRLYNMVTETRKYSGEKWGQAWKQPDSPTGSFMDTRTHQLRTEASLTGSRCWAISAQSLDNHKAMQTQGSSPEVKLKNQNKKLM